MGKGRARICVGIRTTIRWDYFVSFGTRISFRARVMLGLGLGRELVPGLAVGLTPQGIPRSLFWGDFLC